MAEPLFTLPCAVLPEGADPATFYAGFAGKLATELSGDGLIVWAADEPDVALVHAPVKAAMRFAAAGSTVGGSVVATDSLLLQTWPLAYTDLDPLLPSPVPAEIRIGNVDRAGVRAAVRDLYVAIGRPEAAVDAFLTGDGLLLVKVGVPIGTAASGASPPDLARPKSVEVTAYDAEGAALNVTQLFADGAALAGIDATLHPLLAAIEIEGWIDVVVLDDAGNPVPNEPYVLYLSDNTTRNGATNTEGRISETGMPPGDWALDLPNLPSFAFIEQEN
jgi:hypothetical protein